jgi:hypothetical protein
MNAILGQLVRTRLLDDDMAAVILAGNIPLLKEIVLQLVIGAMDCEGLVRGDAEASWTEKRLARQCLALVFLSALSCVNEQKTYS